MNNNHTILVFGASGNVGKHFINQAINAGLKVKAFVRNAEKYRLSAPKNVETIQGDATNLVDVQKAVKGITIIVSCLGNVKVYGKYIHIMYTAHSHILQAAQEQKIVPRCILISSIGCGGTSWLIKQMLQLIGGKATFEDYEKADKRIREEKIVPFLLVRPYALTNKKGKGKYYATKNQKGTFLKPISRADVATFMLDALSDNKWDGPPGVLLGGC